MPFDNYDHARTWHKNYARRVDHGELTDHPLFGQVVSYGRTRANLMAPPWGRLSWHEAYWSALTAAVSIPTDANVLFVGCGHAFMGDVARAAGWSSLGFTDDSNWIHATKNDLAWRHDGNAWVQDQTNALETIEQLPLSSTAQIKNAMKSVFGTPQGEPDWVVTDFMLSNLLDPTEQFYDPGEGDSDEVTPAFDDCDALLAAGGTVLHLVTNTPSARPGRANAKTLAEWKALRPGHLFAPAAYGTGFEVL